MKVNNLLGVKIIKLNKFTDNRGFFYESFNKKIASSKKIPKSYFQDNISYSLKKGTIRGLHYQKKPNHQGKLVHVLKGSIQDIIVDLRKSSKDYGNYMSVNLSSKNDLQIYIPSGCAHGFLTLMDDTIVMYKVTKQYNKNSEVSILWNDRTLNINWVINKKPILSQKDKNGIKLESI